MALFPEHHELPLESQYLLLLHERDYFHESVAISQGVSQDVLFYQQAEKKLGLGPELIKCNICSNWLFLCSDCFIILLHIFSDDFFMTETGEGKEDQTFLPENVSESVSVVSHCEELDEGVLLKRDLHLEHVLL